jgi:hypothetical protein
MHQGRDELTSSASHLKAASRSNFPLADAIIAPVLDSAGVFSPFGFFASSFELSPLVSFFGGLAEPSFEGSALEGVLVFPEGDFVPFAGEESVVDLTGVLVVVDAFLGGILVSLESFDR